MQKLDVKEDGSKKYVEYKGGVLQVKHSRRQQRVVGKVQAEAKKTVS